MTAASNRAAASSGVSQPQVASVETILDPGAPPGPELVVERLDPADLVEPCVPGNPDAVMGFGMNQRLVGLHLGACQPCARARQPSPQVFGSRSAGGRQRPLPRMDRRRYLRLGVTHQHDPQGTLLLEGRFIRVAHEVLLSGSSVILDFGCWSPEERYAIRVVAELVHADLVMEYLKVDEAQRRARSAERWRSRPKSCLTV